MHRPNDDQMYYKSDNAELMEESNRELRDQVKELILTVKDALQRVEKYETNRNKFTLFPSYSNHRY